MRDTHKGRWMENKRKVEGMCTQETKSDTLLSCIIILPIVHEILGNVRGLEKPAALPTMYTHTLITGIPSTSAC